MRNIVVTSVVALTFVGACGAEPDATDTSESALRVGPTQRIAAQVTETSIASDLPSLGYPSGVPALTATADPTTVA